jgi:hypothetical protein
LAKYVEKFTIKKIKLAPGNDNGSKSMKTDITVPLLATGVM